MTISITNFRIRFPEFVSTGDDRIQLFLDDGILILNESYWGDKYELGVYYYAAHELSLSEKMAAGGGSSGGQVSSRSVDGVSISYTTRAADSDKEAYYAMTPYGLKYWSLLKSLPVSAYAI